MAPATATQAELAAAWALGLCARAGEPAQAARSPWGALGALAAAVERGEDVPAAQVSVLALTVRRALDRHAPALARSIDAQAALGAAA